MKSIFQHQAATDNMSFVVKEYYQPHFTSPFHFHDSYELILIAKSYGKLYAGNKVLNFNDGEVYLFGPGFAHCFYNEQSFIKSGEIAHAIVIFFKEDFLGREFFSKGELAKVWELLSKADRGIQLQANDLIRSFFYQITGSKGLQTLILLLQLLNHLSGLKKEEITFINKTIPKLFSKDSNTNKLEAVFKYVIENFKEEVSSKDAASLACLSEAAFCRYFKRRTEKTFSQFVNHVRITHSTRLLLEQDMSIANVCFECGFGNISYFNRQFKKIMGQTPFEYRSAHAPKEADLLE
ncbi:AraC family transcriptional regulator [Chitinophaga defluvii]|uniref:AraC family transcriptional regulator n=1 Tax=Chitinophaga defluvii TaxID=3163343 RepID=A0ABV2T0B3_9BACT